MNDQIEYFKTKIKSIKWAYLTVLLILLTGIYVYRHDENAIIYLGILLVILEAVIFVNHLKAIDGLEEAKNRMKIEKENEEKRIRRAIRKTKDESHRDTF